MTIFKYFSIAIVLTSCESLRMFEVAFANDSRIEIVISNRMNVYVRCHFDGRGTFILFLVSGQNLPVSQTRQNATSLRKFPGHS